MDFDRLLRPNPFANDDGSLQPQMAAALSQQDHAKRQESVVAAIGTGRLFLAVLPHAHPGVQGDGAIKVHDPEGTQEAAQEEAGALTVDAPGGLKAMPAFTSMAALSAFDAQARPMPVEGQAAAAQALLNTGIIALDPTDVHGTGATFVGRTATVSLAMDEPWFAPWLDPSLSEKLNAAVAHLPEVLGIKVLAGARGLVRLTLRMSDYATQDHAMAAAHNLIEVARHDQYVASRLDLLEVVPVRMA
ncbi:MAG: SseB family protein [Ancrocorticia sp.]|uniref:SseB family protein n=1 Tax=Ancrocorticia sp. TaxID=2593684 RepID=UPI003F929408